MAILFIEIIDFEVERNSLLTIHRRHSRVNRNVSVNYIVKRANITLTLTVVWQWL